MLYSSLAYVLTTLSLFFSVGDAARAGYALKESHHVPSKWSRLGPAPAGHLIQLQIGLKQSNFSELERHLFEVSDPSHHRYGQHLSGTEVQELIKPSTEALDHVSEWLLVNNVSLSQIQYSPAKDWVKATLPVAVVEQLLDTKYFVYKHQEDGTSLVRTPRWSLPAHLHQHIHAIQPTNSFFRPGAQKSQIMRVMNVPELSIARVANSGNDALSKACNTTEMTPSCLRTLYGTLDYTPSALNGNQIALTNYLDEANNRSDISIFLQKYRPDAVSAAYNFTVQIVANGDNQQTPNNASELDAGKDQEGNLDAETIIGLTYPTNLTTYNTGGSPPFVSDMMSPTNTNEPYLVWLQYVLNQTTLPQVISTSYGDNEQTVPRSYAEAICNGFAQLGARGVSVLFASGDNGVGKSGDCFTNDGKNKSAFLPEFPASCPYVTTVGGSKDIKPEVVAYDASNNFSSGGGFSNYFARPSYQDSVVSSYISNLGSQFEGLYNTSGRGYPDIAAQGFKYVTIWNGTEVFLDGTRYFSYHQEG
ncbi:hypothetical protein BP6252_05777 [Coleophoma cylindrospora]|uniref:Peptidase S53 domain-containing protein n=1 Tax=Coleophoma cylindrospora TaxID=1849047 RepID=A0A3D8RV35_9HELO|nr:hypothetical protein BP6252_05777 [Coleophoma cylindrospora]